MTDGKSLDLTWSSSLEDASWPVKELINALIKDGRIPVICLNPSHGKIKPGYNYDQLNERNLKYLRDCLSILN